jgi:hypothetical protein
VQDTTVALANPEHALESIREKPIGSTVGIDDRDSRLHRSRALCSDTATVRISCTTA